MKIACIIHSLDGGGAERVLSSLASRLAGRAHQVVLITLGDGGGDRHDLDAAVSRRRLDLLHESQGVVSKLLHTRRRISTLRAAIVAESPDVILSFCDRTNILASLATRPTRIPIVLSERSDPSQQPLGTVWEYLRGRAYPHATHLVALTDTSAAHLRNRFSVPVSVIPSAVDRPPIVSDRVEAAARYRILGIGRLEHEKGFDRLIDAFSKIAVEHGDWSLRILGEGSKRGALESQARELGLSDRITMPGWVQPVWNELAEATLFVLPSRYEGFPSALLEAMAAGVPSIAVNCESGPRAVLEPGPLGPGKFELGQMEPGKFEPGINAQSQCGLLVPNDSTSLANGIRMMIQDEPLRERLAQAGQSVVDRFGWTPMVDAYEQVLLAAMRNS